MKILASNKRAKFDYDLSETIVAGVVLSGPEVKSAKAGHVSLKGSFVSINRGELYLLNTHISPYQPAQDANYEPTRSRKLLVHGQQLKRLIGLKQSGLSLVPTAVGLEHGLVKVEFGIGRGRKRQDKRAVIKKREADRDIARAQKK